MEDLLIKIRRDLHQIAELSFLEKETQNYLKDKLLDYGIESQPCAGTGLVINLGKQDLGNAILFRADIDALPILEETNLSFKSKNAGVMHACGHDGHSAILLATILATKKIENQLKRPIKFIFQPAEEQGGGAKVMVDDGVLDNPKVTEAYGLHLCNRLKSGQIGVASGIFSAFIDEFSIKITGRGGHAARPYQCVEPMILAARLLIESQLMLSREISAMNANVLTFASIKSGERFNVIPDSCEILGTLRSLSKTDRLYILNRLKQKCDLLASEYKATIHLELKTAYPAINNDKTCVSYVIDSATKVLGKEAITNEIMGMGGEDMSYFLEKVKGTYFLLGSGGEDLSYAQHHNPKFNFDENVLKYGMQIFLDLIQKRAID